MQWGTQFIWIQDALGRRMLSLSGPKAREFMRLLIPLVTWSVVNVIAEVNKFRLTSLDTNRVSLEEGCLPSFEVVNCRLKYLAIYFGEDTWGAVKCDCLVLSLGRRFTIYCFDSSPQFWRICIVIQRLHKSSIIIFVGDAVLTWWFSKVSIWLRHWQVLHMKLVSPPLGGI